MRMNVLALSIASGLLWGTAICFVSCVNLVWPEYGSAFLDVMASIYPGYTPGTGVGPLVTGTLYGMADGACAGAFFGWFYNMAVAAFGGRRG